MAALVLLACSDGEGRQAHTDDQVGLSYEVPSSWRGPFTDDLTFLSSAFATVDIAGQEEAPDGEPTALVGAGSFDETFFDPGTEGLADAARQTAIGMAEFFVPAEGEREELDDESFTVEDVEGHRVRYRIVTGEADADVSTVELVALDTEPPAYVLGIVFGRDAELEADVTEALSSVRAVARRSR